MSNEENRESTESFFLDPQNLNHLDENSAEELKSQKKQITQMLQIKWLTKKISMTA